MKRIFFQSAGLYLRDSVVYINPYCRTRIGIRVGMSEVAISSLIQPQDLGEKLLWILDKCIDNVRDEDVSGKNPSTIAIPAKAGLRSWRSFQAKSLYVGAFRELKSSIVELTPGRNVGGGSDGILEKQRLSGVDPLELGNNVVVAFSYAC
jgi:hypothetical protein